MEENFANELKLLIRLKTAFDRKQKFTFLVGSGLTNSNLAEGELGVGSVSEIISDIQKIFQDVGQGQLFDDELSGVKNETRYQKSMKLLLDCYGQDELNKVIFHSVLKARQNKTKPSLQNVNNYPIELEKDIENWHLRRGVEALGELFVDFNNSFSGPILTSNFDPLIEVSIKKHQGTPQSVFLINDGKFSNYKSEGVHQVLHFHGYWTGDDTLHTIDQLTRQRPQLKGDLRKLLNNTLLVVLGYGGWDDVFTNTLVELIKEGGNNFNVLWTFFDKDEESISKKHSNIIGKLSPAIGHRVILYKGVNCHTFLPKLLATVNEDKTTEDVTEDFQNKIEPFTSSSRSLEISVVAKNIFECDVPPNNSIWVGRQDEIKEVLDTDFKTCFITGIGGQGKSGLASHIVKHELNSSHDFEYWDWRDCKDEDNRIHTIVTSQIERISNGRIRAINILSETTEKVIELFFETLADQKILFVFDNVDKYIDYEKNYPIKGIAKIFEIANTLDHNSKFIFTCRPTIHYESPTFHQIKLGALTAIETELLFKESKANLNSEQLTRVAKEAHSITNGHPLWLHLILAQAKSGYATVETFLHDIKAHRSLSADTNFYLKVENTLNVVWKSLNKNQQDLLRGLAEAVTALTDQEIIQIMSSLISANQCGKSLRKLMNLNLLVVKSSEDRIDQYELHPLVKEFILNKFQKNERSSYITLLVKYYDAIILVIKPKLNADSPLSYFQKWTSKVELQINKGDYQDALMALQEISTSIQAAGYVAEYLRVAFRLFIEIDWLKAITEEYPYFHDQVTSFIHALIEYGRFDEAEAHLEKYAKNISGKGNNYVNYCNHKAYMYWFKCDYDTAIEWSNKGIKLLNNPDINTNKDLTHNLALALRDTNEAENLKRALEIFLRGEVLEDVIDPKTTNLTLPGGFYGNIGRCLWLMGDMDGSLVCYKKAMRQLIEEQSSTTIVNLGWGLMWIGEVLEKQKKYNETFYFYKRCLFYWEKAAPVKVRQIEKRISILLKKYSLSKKITAATDIKIENFIRDFIEK